MSRQKGFTLLEVMVALAVLAIGVSSLFLGMVQYSRNALSLKETTVAGWVARNLVAQSQLTVPWPGPSDKRGKEEMADHTWYWHYKVSKTDDPGVRRIDVEVRLNEDDENPLVDYVAYIGKK
jgi:general secretion pathway protein I